MNRRFDIDSVSMLLHRAKSGCGDSRNQLIDQLQSYMILLAGRYSDEQLKRKLGVSDIVQQSMVNVVRGFDDFRGDSEGEFKAWLKAVLRNEIHRIRRDYGREKRDVSREKPLDFSKNGIKGSLTSPESSPVSKVINHERLFRMREAIKQLSPDDAKVVRLRSLERLSFKEIAPQLNRSVDATTKLWYRAIIKLQQIMKQDESTD